MEFKLKPIGIIHSPFKRNEEIDVKKFADPKVLTKSRESWKYSTNTKRDSKIQKVNYPQFGRPAL
jgi:hypothetical protein